MEAKNVLYYELLTEYGPLYIYEIYTKDPRKFRELPVTREFFTGEIGIRGYYTLTFLDKSLFPTSLLSMDGGRIHDYMIELSPLEFLDRVGYFMDDNRIEGMKECVYSIFERKAKNIGNNMIILEQPRITENQKNDIAAKVLAKHITDKKQTF